MYLLYTIYLLIVYEDENVFAFLDIRPLHVGHTLVIPKHHYETLDDLPSEVIEKTIITIITIIIVTIIKKYSSL